MQQLSSLSESLLILLNSKYKKVIGIDSDKHVLYNAYSSWLFHVRKNFNNLQSLLLINNDNNLQIICVLLDHLIEQKNNNLKFEHSKQLLFDCLTLQNNEINKFIFKMLLFNLKYQSSNLTNQENIKLLQYKYSICTFFYEILKEELNTHLNKEINTDLNKEIINNFKLWNILTKEEINELIDSLFFVIKFESLILENKKCPTKLTSKANDLIFLIFYLSSISENYKILLWDNYNLIIQLIEELIQWFEIYRPLYSEVLNYLLIKLKEINKIKEHLNILQNLNKYSEIEGTKNIGIKILSGLFSSYSYFLIENEDILNNYFLNTITTKDKIFTYLLVLMKEIESCEENKQLLYCLICLLFIIGKMKKKEIKKIFLTSLKPFIDKEITFHQMLYQLTVNKLIKSNDIEIGNLSIHLFKELLNFQNVLTNKSEDSIFSHLLQLLEQEDITSNAIILFTAEHVKLNYQNYLSNILELIESDNKIKRKNGLNIILNIFKSRKIINNELSKDLINKTINYLLKRFSDEDIQIRKCCSKIFSKLNPNYIIPLIIPFYLSKSEKERSCAHESLFHIMESNTETIDAYLVLVEVLRTFNITIDDNNDQKQQQQLKVRKELAERVMTFLPQYLIKLSPKKIEELAIELVKQFLEFSNDPTLVYILNKTLNVLLSIEGDITIILSEVEYNLKCKLETLYSILQIVLNTIEKNKEIINNNNNTIMKIDKEIQEQLIFKRLAPLLILRTLPQPIFTLITDNKLCQSIFNLLMNTIIDKENEFDEIRKVSAEVSAKFPMNISMNYFLNEFYKYFELKDFNFIKLFLFCICQGLTVHEQEKDEILKYIKGNDLFYGKLIDLLKILPNMVNVDQQQELLKLQYGCIDCIVIIINILYKYNSINLFIENNILNNIKDNTNISFKICLINILTKSIQILPLKYKLNLSDKIVPLFYNIIIPTNNNTLQNNTLQDNNTLICSCMQCLLHLTYQLKSSIHPYSKMILEIISKTISFNEDSKIRLSGLKLLSGILVAREDVIIDFKSIFEFEIFKKLIGLSKIENDIQVKKLAMELVKLLHLD
ncbi:hypothetical protein ABK040_003421 [Willaertia magna]